VLKHLQSSEDWSQKSIGAKGFTLIELLVVIVILGILGAVVVFSVRGVTNDAKKSSCATAKRTIATAAEAYYAKNGSYTSVANLKTGGYLSETDTGSSDFTFTVNTTTGEVTASPACPT